MPKTDRLQIRISPELKQRLRACALFKLGGDTERVLSQFITVELAKAAERVEREMAEPSE